MPDLSFEDIRDRLSNALNVGRAGNTYTYIRNVYPDAVVFAVSDDSAIAPGELYRAPYSWSESGEVIIGEKTKVTERRVYDVAKFNFSVDGAEPSESGDVVWSGMIFRAGDYPDKGVSFSESDLDEMVANHAPAKFDIEHAKTVFDGKLGELTSISRVGNELHGRAILPRWLYANVLRDKKVPVSVEITKAKPCRVTGVALTLNPRVADAELSAAFSAGPGLRNGKPMDIIESLKAALGLAPAEAAPAVTAPPVVAPVVDDAEKVAMSAQIQDLAKVAIAARVNQFESEAAPKLVPASMEKAKVIFAGLVAADLDGDYKFNAGSLVVPDDGLAAQFSAFVTGLPDHGLTQEMIASGSQFARIENQPIDKDSESRIASMRSGSPTLSRGSK